MTKDVMLDQKKKGACLGGIPLDAQRRRKLATVAPLAAPRGARYHLCLRGVLDPPGAPESGDSCTRGSTQGARYDLGLRGEAPRWTPPGRTKMATAARVAASREPGIDWVCAGKLPAGLPRGGEQRQLHV